MGVIENDLNEDTFIGCELPMTYTSNGFFNRTKTALIQSKSNIKNLLLTNKGERLGNPTFGTNLLSLVFSQENTDLESRVEEEIRSAMSEFLPFINIVSIETNFSDTNKDTASVRLKFTLNVDLTSEEDLTLDLSAYTGNLAQDPHDGFQTLG
jgi:phage baseplate assembly protein W|tara:strand:+ start:363 stop:821 length:459 start_codon:yes stop_codon:yes gene_type:complete